MHPKNIDIPISTVPMTNRGVAEFCRSAKKLHLICRFQYCVFRVMRLCTVLGFVFRFSRLWGWGMGRLLLTCWGNILSSPSGI